MSGMNFIAVCSSLHLRNTLIKAIEQASGITPIGVGDTKSVERAYYADAMTRSIINSSGPEVMERLGNPCSAAAIEVDGEPTAAAELAREVFEGRNYSATVIDDAETGLPKGFMAFLVVPALRGLVILFWKKKENIDPAIINAWRASGRFAPWSSAELS